MENELMAFQEGISTASVGYGAQESFAQQAQQAQRKMAEAQQAQMANMPAQSVMSELLNQMEVHSDRLYEVALALESLGDRLFGGDAGAVGTATAQSAPSSIIEHAARKLSLHQLLVDRIHTAARRLEKLA